MRVGVGMIFRRLFLVSISVISVIRSFNLPAILVVLDHRFFQFSTRGVVPLLCHTPYSRSRLVRCLPGKYLVWKRSFLCSSFRPARRSCTCYFFCIIKSGQALATSSRWQILIHRSQPQTHLNNGSTHRHCTDKPTFHYAYL